MTEATETAVAEIVERLREALSDGLNLCKRARQMTEREHERIERQLRDPELTRSVTIPLWAEELYRKDLAAWEERVRLLLTAPTGPQPGTIRVCPERDARCPHGINCPYSIDRGSCDMTGSRRALLQGEPS